MATRAPNRAATRGSATRHVILRIFSLRDMIRINASSTSRAARSRSRASYRAWRLCSCATRHEVSTAGTAMRGLASTPRLICSSLVGGCLDTRGCLPSSSPTSSTQPEQKRMRVPWNRSSILCRVPHTPNGMPSLSLSRRTATLHLWSSPAQRTTATLAFARALWRIVRDTSSRFWLRGVRRACLM